MTKLILENKSFLVYDLETLEEMFLGSFYDPRTEKFEEFVIDSTTNNLYEIVKFYNRSSADFYVGFNNLNFDSQVMEYILENANKWSGFTSEAICKDIYKFVQKLIEDSNYGIRVPYPEWNLSVDQLDCYTILGLDNEARRTSLKAAQFNLDYHSVEEMPIHHSTKDLTQEQKELIKSYCRNDILSTYKLFTECILGDSERELYKGKNVLNLRNDLKQQFNLNCLNMSDIKLGDELLKQSYAKEIGKSVADLPKQGYFRKVINLKQCIPDYVKFESKELQNLLKSTYKTILQDQKHVSEFSFKGTDYTIGLGGGHSDNKNQIWEADEDNELIDLDVGSLYPAIIVNNEYYPKHLGIELLRIYKQRYHERIKLKPQASSNPAIAAICEGLKLQLNVAYGKMGSKDSWMYDKKVQVSVCLTGQFALLMLVEAMELNGIHVFSFNTDGITLKLHKSKKEIFEKICQEWMTLTKFTLERTDYQKIVYATVNDYIAVKTDGKIKKKGDFLTEFELWKNPSKRVIAKALEAYFIKGEDPVTFVKSQKNIYDFCIRGRAKGGTKLITVPGTTVGKLCRYYLQENGPELFKVGIGTKGQIVNANQNAPNEIGKQGIRLFNQYEKLDDYNIDYRHYIYQVFKKIDSIENTNKAKGYLESISDSKQLKLF